jgi:hypothetical protein
MKKSTVIAMGLAGALFSSHALAEDMTLVSKATDNAPVLDGMVEDLWSNAPALEVRVDKLPYKPNNGYPGISETVVTMRALHDSENIYLLYQYADPTKSLERFPWVKQEDGSWKQKKNLDSTGHGNTYYEDAVLWDINARGFGKKGCDAACHMAQDGEINGTPTKSPGRKYTTREGQTIDMWHWKSVRSWPVDQVDDQFIDDTANPEENKNWGRKGDAKTGGGYRNNVSEDGTQPAFMPSDGSTGAYWLLKDEAVPFEDNFKPGDVLPGVVVSPFEGSRGDISAKAKWEDGTWTIEVRRPLKTTGEKAEIQDVQFDPADDYDFGIAVFDNSQINHIYHEGVITLKFEE